MATLSSCISELKPRIFLFHLFTYCKHPLQKILFHLSRIYNAFVINSRLLLLAENRTKSPKRWRNIWTSNFNVQLSILILVSLKAISPLNYRKEEERGKNIEWPVLVDQVDSKLHIPYWRFKRHTTVQLWSI